MLKILKRLSLINKQHYIGATHMDFEAVQSSMDLGKMMILFLLSGLDCVKVVKYKSKINGTLTITNFSLDSLEEFSLCLRVFSYSFSSPKEKSVQSLVRVGDRSLLGFVTHQHCNGCNTREFLCRGFDVFFFNFVVFLPRGKIFWFLGTRESEGIL